MVVVDPERGREYREAWAAWQRQLGRLHEVFLEGASIGPPQLKGLLNREARAKERYDAARDALLGLGSAEGRLGGGGSDRLGEGERLGGGAGDRLGGGERLSGGAGDRLGAGERLGGGAGDRLGGGGQGSGGQGGGDRAGGGGRGGGGVGRPGGGDLESG